MFLTSRNIRLALHEGGVLENLSVEQDAFFFLLCPASAPSVGERVGFNSVSHIRFALTIVREAPQLYLC